MAKIDELTAVSAVVAGDLFAVYSATNGDTRSAAASVVLDYVQDNITVEGQKITQYAAPSSSPSSIAVTDSSSSVWLVDTPTGTIASTTITLPAVANCVDKQELLLNTTQTLTSITWAGNGATVTGAPTTLSANGFARLRYNALNTTWYRVG